MSREGQRGQKKGAARRKASGAPRGGSDRGLVSLLASAPGASVKALQGQFVLCTVLGVLLLAVLLSLATDYHSRAHSRAQRSSTPLPLGPSLAKGAPRAAAETVGAAERVRSAGAEGAAEAGGAAGTAGVGSEGEASESEDDPQGAESGEEWGSETGAGVDEGEGAERARAEGAEGAAGAGSDGSESEAGRTTHSHREGSSVRGREHQQWMGIMAKGRTSLSAMFARQLEEARRGNTSTHGTATTSREEQQGNASGVPEEHQGQNPLSAMFARQLELAKRRGTRGAAPATSGASSWFARKHGRALRRHYPNRGWGSGGHRPRGKAQPPAHPQPSLPRWAPKPGKYLLAYCQLYGWTNKLICMERALMFAVLLNRTLILPQQNVCTSPKRPRNTDHMLIDVRHLRECLAQGILINQTATGFGYSPGSGFAAASGSDMRGGVARRAAGWEKRRPVRQQGAVHERLASYGVVTLHEYQRALGMRRVTADVLLCELRKCPFKHCTCLGRLGFANSTKPSFRLYGTQLTEEDLAVLRDETAHAGVLSLGDVFYTAIKGYPLPIRTSLAPLFGTSCPLPVKPHQAMFRIAEDFAASHFKGPYAALHLRRGDFEKYLGERRIPYWSIPQVAECVASEMRKQGLTKLFLATDATFPERKELQALLGKRDIIIRLYRPGWRQTNMNQALVDKVMCAHAQVFLYERLSTFSGHILQLRQGLGRNSSHDKPLCAGRRARFVPHVV